MGIELIKPQARATPIQIVDPATFARASAGLAPERRRWLATQGFTGAPDTQALLPDAITGSFCPCRARS